jgi:hypothetical protein
LSRRNGSIVACTEINIDGLVLVAESLQHMSFAVGRISNLLDLDTDGIESLFSTLDVAMKPLADFGGFVERILSPIITVFEEVVDALSFLR